jgi:hypothetical protein
MQGHIEELIRQVYREYKQGLPLSGEHPDEETLAAFLEAKLPPQEAEKLKAHLITCPGCLESVTAQLRLGQQELTVPQDLLDRAKSLVEEKPGLLLEIYLRLKESLLEIIHTTGDVLVGQELVPAPLLRSRKIKDFKDEVTILKDFSDIRVEAKVENKMNEAFTLTVTVKEKSSQKILKDLRVTLIKDDVEMESSLSDSGKVIFEHVLLGKYTVEISTLDKKLAGILLDIKV